MNRRQFNRLLGGAAVVWASVARAQNSAKAVPKIGILWHANNAQEEQIYLGAFRDGLQRLGYVDGRNVILENRFAGEKYERFKAQALELIHSKVDVLVASSTPAAIAAAGATSTVPIVCAYVTDPVHLKLVSSLAHPGGNVTGLSGMTLELMPKQVQFLTQAIADFRTLPSSTIPIFPSLRGWLRDTKMRQKYLH